MRRLVTGSAGSDLARAHVLALDQLERSSEAFNLGCGGGYTVLEVIAAAHKITGHSIPIRIGPRRDGDPAVLVASSETIIASAWEWMQNHPIPR